jgi:hypothetical protein
MTCSAIRRPSMGLDAWVQGSQLLVAVPGHGDLEEGVTERQAGVEPVHLAVGQMFAAATE